jgi:hypothetical protein
MADHGNIRGSSKACHGGGDIMPRGMIGKTTSGFSILGLAGLQAWYSPQDSADYTLSGSDVTAIADKSGNGQDLVTEGGFLMSLGSTSLNGVPGFVSSGKQYAEQRPAAGNLASKFQADNQNLTFIYVVQPTGSQNYAYGISLSNETGSDFSSEIGVRGSIGRPGMVWNNSHKAATYPGDWAAADRYIDAVRYDGTNVDHFQNDYKGVTPVAYDSPAITLNHFMLGARSLDGRYWSASNAVWGDVIICNEAVSDDDILAAIAYLNDIYSVY